ncbi:hypothetical protein [Candidatus Nitrosocosmicus arcticus]|uniref:Uncharacterized protein n=1 Tax=Candidatus Nitrosocosmicus arcticus TaxID=2035267 RepID=A0A557SVG0_9ARCH|nr:hypothetical protein [Candidatus Nitrosocosmicus arcticus]TVP40586.1 hypothetical protein NARC_70168 [Candidatus Nitrosocosmicus arcticus]
MSELEINLRKIKADSKMSDSQKIKMFYDLMLARNIEPIVLRLSGYIKNKPMKIDYLLTFTPTRIIMVKKNKLRKLIDPGFVAGIGPYLYYILSEKIEYSDIKIKDSFISKEQDPAAATTAEAAKEAAADTSDEVSIKYPDIKKMVFYSDTKTLVSNMLGTAVKENVLIIHTVKEKYEFILPAGKNGPYNKTVYWLKTCLPVKISDK